MANTKFWKVWLKPNLLTKDVDNDYIAESSTSNERIHPAHRDAVFYQYPAAKGTAYVGI